MRVRLRFNRLPTASAPTSVMPVLRRLHGQSVCVWGKRTTKKLIKSRKERKENQKDRGKGGERERNHHVSEFTEKSGECERCHFVKRVVVFSRLN